MDRIVSVFGPPQSRSGSRVADLRIGTMSLHYLSLPFLTILPDLITLWQEGCCGIRNERTPSSDQSTHESQYEPRLPRRKIEEYMLSNLVISLQLCQVSITLRFVRSLGRGVPVESLDEFE